MQGGEVAGVDVGRRRERKKGRKEGGGRDGDVGGCVYEEGGGDDSDEARLGKTAREKNKRRRILNSFLFYFIYIGRGYSINFENNKFDFMKKIIDYPNKLKNGS